MESKDQYIKISTEKDPTTGQTIVRATLTFGYSMFVDENYGEDPDGKEFIDTILKNKLRDYIRNEVKN